MNAGLEGAGVKTRKWWSLKNALAWAIKAAERERLVLVVRKGRRWGVVIGLQVPTWWKAEIKVEREGSGLKLTDFATGRIERLSWERPSCREEKRLIC